MTFYRFILFLPAIFVSAALGDTFFVKEGNPFAELPYTNWASAAASIQDALDVAGDGDTVWVTNGVYDSGIVSVAGQALTTRISISNNVHIRSVNDPEDTIILGDADPETDGAGSNAVRCVYMTAGTLDGFTISNGFTLAVGASDDLRGGGVYATGGSLIDCRIRGNGATGDGGGVYGGTLARCTVAGNSADRGGGLAKSQATDCEIRGNEARVGGGAHLSSLTNCFVAFNVAIFGGGIWSGDLKACLVSNNTAALEGGGGNGGVFNDCIIAYNRAGGGGGGGVVGSTLYRCRVYENFGREAGGGAQASILYACWVFSNVSSNDGGGIYTTDTFNSLIYDNATVDAGGGAYKGTHINSTLARNSAGRGGGIYQGTVLNCIVYHNDAQTGTNTHQTVATYTCSIPDEGGEGNISNDPRFGSISDHDYRLTSASACIDAGAFSVQSTNDISGTIRPQDGNDDGVAAWDMGAYEFLYPSGLLIMLW